MAGHTPARRFLIPSVTGLAAGVGDGLVAQIPMVDRFPHAQLAYRMGVITLGAVGIAMGWNEEMSEALLAGPLYALGSRVPAALRGGGIQQFGYAAPLPGLVRPARLGAAPHTG